MSVAQARRGAGQIEAHTHLICEPSPRGANPGGVLFGAVGCRARLSLLPRRVSVWPLARAHGRARAGRAMRLRGERAERPCCADGRLGTIGRQGESPCVRAPPHVGPRESRDAAAHGGGAVAAVARPAWVVLPVIATPTARPMPLRGPGATRAEPRAPVDAAIVALVPLAAAGDKAAFTRLVETFHADMARLAYFVCGGNRELAEDAVQSAWAIAWSRLGTLRDHDRIRPWLLSVTANEARQVLRHQRQMVAVHLEFAEERLAGPDPFASAAALDMAQGARAAQARGTDSRWTALCRGPRLRRDRRGDGHVGVGRPQSPRPAPRSPASGARA